MISAQRHHDGFLVQRFPEVPWMRPVAVRWLDARMRRPLRRYACPFCLYRRGLLGPARARLSEYSEEVWKHLALEHQPPIPICSDAARY